MVNRWKGLYGIIGAILFFLSIVFLPSLLEYSNDQPVDQNKVKLVDMEERSNVHQNSEVLEFFGVKDALEITWLHAVNDVKKLEEGLSGEAMMLEADVIMGHNRVDVLPIMAHPPATDSDLSLEEFLKKTIGSNKGIKLDFKSMDAVEPSLKILQEKVSMQKIHNPVWLNADILPGPCNIGSCIPLEPQLFLALCTKYFPRATLSVGWTTSPFTNMLEDRYDWSFVQPMRDLLSGVSQPVTFPIRANLVGKSRDQILWLLSLSHKHTLTIWSVTHDQPIIKDLLALRNAVSDKRRIFYDLPSGLRLKFLEELESEA